MICVAVTHRLHRRRRGRNYGRPWLFHCHILLACGPMSLALALHGGLYYVGLAVLLVLFFIGAEAHQPQPARRSSSRR